MTKFVVNTSFECKPSKANKQGLSPVYMTVVVSGIRTSIQTPFKADAGEFKKAMASKKQNPINSYCYTLRKKMDDLVDDMLQKDIPITAINIKKYYQAGGVSNCYTLKELFGEQLALLKQRVGAKTNPLSQDTYNRYEKTTQMFMAANGLDGDTPANSVTPFHFATYQIELAKNLDDATSCNYLQKIKTFFLHAHNAGKILSNPADGLKIKRGQKENIKYLTEEQLIRVRVCDCKGITRLEGIRDCFVFCCFTGLAYSDLAELQPEDFKRNARGQYYIKKKRIKTGVTFCTVLLEDAIDIAKKYNFRLPVKSNQKYNAYLKELGDLAFAPFPLTTHVARHTAATYLLNKGIPIEVVSKILGHSTTKETYRYAKLLDNTIFDKLAEIDYSFLNDDDPGWEPEDLERNKKEFERIQKIINGGFDTSLFYCQPLISLYIKVSDHT